MFAIGLTQLDMNQGERYFDIYMQFRHYGTHGRTKTYIPLVACTKQPWMNIGLGDSFDRLGFDKWLCPSPDTELELEGKFTSKDFKFYKFAVKKCNPALDINRPCIADATI